MLFKPQKWRKRVDLKIILEEIKVENFPELPKGIHLQFQTPKQTPNRISKKFYTRTQNNQISEN